MLRIKSLTIQAYIFLLLPVVLFVAGWFRAAVSIPILILIIYSGCRMIVPHDARRTLLAHPGMRDITLTRRYFLIMVVFLLLMLQTGIGGLYYQIGSDPVYRNAVLYDLCRRPWPVIYGDTPDAPFLCYYLAYWLPAAFVGKITGYILPADIFLLLYSTWGVWIALNFFFSLCGGGARWSTLLIFFFFCTLNTVTTLILQPENFPMPGTHPVWYERWVGLETGWDCYAATPISILLYYIYNQGIPTLVGCTLLWQQRRNVRGLLFTAALMAPCAPFPMIAVLPYCGWLMIRSRRTALSIPNLTGLLLIAICGAYYSSNAHGAGIVMSTWHESTWGLLLGALIFCTISYAIYLPFIWRDARRCPAFWWQFAIAVLVPIVVVGGAYDFGWRMSVPLMLMLSAMLCRGFARMKWGKVKWALTLLLIAGAFSPIYIFGYGVYGEIETIREGSSPKKIWLMNQLHNPDRNDYYSNFIAIPPSFYTRYLR